MTHAKKHLIAAVIAVSALVAMPVHANTLASWNPLTFSAANGNLKKDSLAVQSFAAQTGDLYVQLSITLNAGTVINPNDFAVMWLTDSTSAKGLANVPNIGMKADVNAGGDFMVRSNMSGNYNNGSFNQEQAVVGNSYTLFGHLYKASSSTTYNRFDLWVTPGVASWSVLPNSVPETQNMLDSGLTKINQVGFRNATLHGNDSITISNAAVFSAIPAVPEPETYAMFLAGLGLMAGIARRRQKK